jgi:hypothetical protein
MELDVSALRVNELIVDTGGLAVQSTCA